jgi:O-antigen/teichoic acid export membrane protein
MIEFVMKNDSIKAGVLISYVSILVNIGISLLYTPWMINEIGQSNYGIYSLIVSFISYFLLDLGLGSAISRFIAKYRAENDESQIKEMISVAYTVFMCLSVAISLILVILYFFLSDVFVKLTASELLVLKEAYLIAGLFSVLNFVLKPVDGIMMASEYFVRLKTLDMLQRLGTVTLIGLVLFCGGGLYELVFINGIVALCVSLVKWRYTVRHSHIYVRIGYFNKTMARSLFSFSSWMLVIGIAQRLRLSLLPSVLGVLSGSVEIALFAAAMNLEGLVYNFANALNGLFMPKVSRMATKNKDRTEITKLMIKVGRYQLFIIGFIIMIFGGLGNFFINLWLGESFHKTYYVAMLLILPNIVSMTQQIATTLSYVENEVRYNSVISISCSILSFVVAILLSSKYGAIGCGMAVCLSSVVSLVMLNLFYKNILLLDIKQFFKNCHGKILPVIAPIFFGLVYTAQSIGILSWISLFLWAGVFTIVYFSAVYILLFNSEEKAMIKIIINKFYNK